MIIWGTSSGLCPADPPNASKSRHLLREKGASVREEGAPVARNGRASCAKWARLLHEMGAPVRYLPRLIVTFLILGGVTARSPRTGVSASFSMIASGPQAPKMV